MSVSEEARAAIAAYSAEIADTAESITRVAGVLQDALDQISSTGSLGSSNDPGIVGARERLGLAIVRCREAVNEANASHCPVNALVERVFPP